jgi:hypothetical protein
MPDRSKGMGQKKHSPWSSRLGVVRGANNPTLEEIYCYGTSRGYEGGQDPHRIVAPVKKRFICKQKSKNSSEPKNPVSLSS